MPQHGSTSRRGFILVMTLMLLAIAAVALAAVGRSSMGLAVSAVKSRQDLQRHWGSYSSRHAVLELAPILLDEAEQNTGEPVVSLQTEIQLSGQSYFITVSDEQAKINVNAMLRQHGRDVTMTFVHRQFTDSMGAGEVYLPTEQGPSQVQDIGEAVEADRRIVSLNHLVPDFDPDRFDVADGYPVDMLTCWGDGRINFARASNELVKEITRPVLNAIQLGRLREALASSEDMSLAEGLAGIELAEDDVQAVAERLTLDSHCYSAWITLDNGKRRWQELSVLELEPADDGELPDPAFISTQTQDRPESADQIPSPEHNQVQDQSQALPQSEDGSRAYPRLYLYQW